MVRKTPHNRVLWQWANGMWWVNLFPRQFWGVFDLQSTCTHHALRPLAVPIFRNKGITMATGDVVGILNSDDLFCDEFEGRKSNENF